MKAFHKPPLSITQQRALLERRGLKIHNRQRAEQLLAVVSLFRLSPYMRPFQLDDPEHTFKDGSQLADILAVYRFDSALRHLVMVALEQVEIAVRTGISNHMCCRTQNAHWYLDKTHFKARYNHQCLLDHIQQGLDKEAQHLARERQRILKSQADTAVQARRIEHRIRDNYTRYYGATYNDPPSPPSWAMLEDLSMGAISHLYKGLAQDIDRKTIAKHFSTPHTVFISWLHTLTFVRNICAHHGRLWNRELAIPPQLPKHTDWQLPDHDRGLPNPKHRVYIVLAILAHLMSCISPDNPWCEHLFQLIAENDFIALPTMGFPTDWRSLPQWSTGQIKRLHANAW